MKTLSLLSAGLLFSQVLPAQTPAPGDKPAAADDKAAPGQPGAEPKPAETPPAAENAAPAKFRGLDNLTAEQHKELANGMGEVANYLRGVRNLEALTKLNELEEKVG